MIFGAHLTLFAHRNKLKMDTKIAADLLNAQKEIESLKSNFAALYIPKHFDNMMTKIGNMDKNMSRAQNDMGFCYFVCIFTLMLFLIAVFIGLYIMWKMNYFRLLFRQNRFSRYTRPKSCYSCHRSWKRSGQTASKPNFSSPELMEDTRVHMPVMARNTMHSSDDELDGV